MWRGRIPYGKCDIIPGELFVATEFQHIAWLPVIPIQSWVIVEGSIESYDDYVQSFMLRWDGAPIRFSLKSFFMAWARAGPVIVAVAAGSILRFLRFFDLAAINLLQRHVSRWELRLPLLLLPDQLSTRLCSPQRAEHLRRLIASKYGELWNLQRRGITKTETLAQRP